jgi:hypothetical protein
MLAASQTTFRRSYAFILAATALFVAAADFFFYGHPIGWTAAALSGVMFCLLAARDSTFLQTMPGRILTLALVGLIASMVEEPTWLNVSYAILCTSALALINAEGFDNDFLRWLGRFFTWVLIGWTRLFVDNGIVMRWLVRRGFSPRLARGIAAWILPALLSTVFIGLFAWANPIISDWLGNLGTYIGILIDRLPELINPLRLMFWVGFAMIAWMLLRGRVHRWTVQRYPTPLPPEPVIDSIDRNGIPLGLAIRCLVLFNLIFAVENVLDVVYLYGHSSTTMTSLEYRTYVRRGAYPLVAAALLAGAFVLMTFRPRSESERSRPARGLVYIWIAQTIFLTLSAAARLYRYIDMSELTRLRVASIIWFALVAAGLFYIIWRIVAGRSNRWLINVNAVTALIALYPCCFINFDGIIADFNAKHCEEAGGGGSPLDIQYFRSLGPTSLAALESVSEQIPVPRRRQEASEVTRDLRAELDKDLTDWRSWTWRRQRAAHDADQVANASLLARRPAPPQLARLSPVVPAR